MLGKFKITFLILLTFLLAAATQAQSTFKGNMTVTGNVNTLAQQTGTVATAAVAITPQNVAQGSMGTVGGLSYQKTAATSAWDGGFSSVETLDSTKGGGTFSFRCSQSNKEVIVGVSATDSTRNFSDMLVDMQCTAAGTWTTYHDGSTVIVSGGGSYVATDVFTFVVTSNGTGGSYVSIKKNASFILSNYSVSQTQLRFDTSFYTQNAAIDSVTYNPMQVGVFVDASAGGTAISVSNGGVPKFTVDSSGNVNAASGLTLNTAGGGSKPTCALAARGMFWYVASGAGVKDTVEVCAKDATDTYAWRAIY